ncbi:hypothetical protein, conserved [Eimeria praecox]|uniref:Uncharacterized protein n=1 Tax=Eimeria praecox TaxID=51316 RepID=U6G651_9EIME|nr:hypothetical protein, conserved [Eimeria praecox]
MSEPGGTPAEVHADELREAEVEHHTARVQEPDEGRAEQPNDKERKKHHSKKSKQQRPEGSPDTDSAKRTKKNAKQADEGVQDFAPAKSENDQRSEASEKKKKKKKTVVVAVENAEADQGSLDHSQAPASNKARKSTLLMCDNAAAVALGNLLAIQREIPSTPEAQDETDEGRWFEEIEDEEVDQILAKAKISETRVAELRNAISETSSKALEGYIDELATLTQDKAFMVGIAEEDKVIAVEQKEAQENIAACVAQQKELQQQQQRLLLYEQVIRKKILDELEWREAKLKVLQRQAEKQDLNRQDHLVKLVRECECRMEALMGRRQARLSFVYGLLKKEGEYTAVSRKTEDAKSNERNNFIPMGGTRLRWNGYPTIEEKLLQDAASRKQSKVSLPTASAADNESAENEAFAGTTAAVTQSVEFIANFSDECLKFDQTLELACPSETDVEPEMCLVVGWGAFPLVDSDFRLIEGRFKVPLLRGSVDPSIRRYLDVERLISNNLDSWLCNLYFRCERLPQYTRGQVEFELQLEHAATLLGGRRKETASAKPQQHNHLWEASHERAKAEDLVQQLVSALQACEEISGESSTVVSKDGVRAWRHKDAPSALHSTPDVKALQDYGYSAKVASAIICTVLAVWCCSLIFMLGVWLYLRSAKVPVHNIQFSAFYVRLSFVQELLSLEQTISVTAAGPLACLVAFVLVSLTVHAANITLGMQPATVYQFCSALGAATAINPVLMAVIEGMSSNRTGISFMLFNYYIRDVNNATLGVIIALLIDLTFIGFSIFAYYTYAISVHSHGQVKDTHRRLTGDESLYHLPLDTEVSERYLMGCLESARQYRGPQGEVRKVHATEHPITKPDQDLKESKARRNPSRLGGSRRTDHHLTQLAIYTVNSRAGTQTLYRQFLMHPDGTIVEVLPNFPEGTCPLEGAEDHLQLSKDLDGMDIPLDQGKIIS